MKKEIKKNKFIPLAYNNLYGINKNGLIINFKTSKILKQRITRDGYSSIIIRNKLGLKKKFLIHRLVALAFIPNPENKPTVNHLNGIKYDNRLENLEWATVSENTIHAYENELNTNTNKVVVYDTVNKTNTTFRSIQHLGKFFKIDLKHLLGFIKYSHKYPFKNRYIFKLKNEKHFLVNINSRNNGKKIYCYDHLNKKITLYESIGLLTYVTGIRSILKFTNTSLLSMGYIISHSALDLGECILKCSPYDTVFIKNRNFSRSKEYSPRKGVYYVKDLLNDDAGILIFKSGIEFRKYIFNKYNVNIGNIKLIPRKDQKSNSKLVFGYNIQFKKDNDDLKPWKVYTLEKVLLSRNFKFKHRKCYSVVNRITNETKNIIGNYEAIKYLQNFFLIQKISNIPISKIDEKHLNAISEDIIFSRLNKIKI